MNEEAREYWRSYFCRAPTWSSKMTPGMYDTAMKLMLDGHPGETFTAFGKRVFVNASYHDVDSVSHYIDDPGKCTENPYVYHQMRQLPNLDLKWIDIMIKNRAENYEEINNILKDSSSELVKNAKLCYEPGEMFKLIKDVVEGPKD